MPDRIIKKIGRYSLMEKIGQGSMGVVFKAYDEMLDRLVAVKMMSAETTADTELRRRFYQEAGLAAKLTHPNIVEVFDLGEEDGQVTIAMELLDGTDLKTLIRQGPMPHLQKKLDWMIQLCEALAFAHQRQVIHRDIKPGNIQIRSNESAVIMDFGIARAAQSRITKTGAIIGTPEYISPEQVLAIHADHRADIFSLGIVFYELLTGRHPFRGPTLPSTIHRILNDRVVSPHSLDSSIPETMSQVVLRSLEKDTNRRYQNCEQMGKDLVVCRGELFDKTKEMKEA